MSDSGSTPTTRVMCNVPSANATASADIGQRLERSLSPIGDVERVIGVDDVDEMVPYETLLLRRRLRRPDVHVAVDLSRVRADDLRAEH